MVCCPCGLATKSPGTVSGVSYTNSAEEQCKSSLGAVLTPSMIPRQFVNPVLGGKPSPQGSLYIMVKMFDLWVVGCGVMELAVHNLDVNCEPLSEVMSNDMPI